ncbi:unnamed protein product [Microthlaspi erraticum]|uniref:Glutathione peroxidase n=1 Tax=Microthlaspi erraticum TaxID=1685480 RepID=A0A6D2HS67_9BRAS|nr:unnamed protein product [Microthlaspi erraticum]
MVEIESRRTLMRNKVLSSPINSCTNLQVSEIKQRRIFGDGIKWNFAKFLIDKDGNVVDRYAPTTSPLSIEKDLKKLLGVTA